MCRGGFADVQSHVATHVRRVVSCVSCRGSRGSRGPGLVPMTECLVAALSCFSGSGVQASPFSHCAASSLRCTNPCVLHIVSPVQVVLQVHVGERPEAEATWLVTTCWNRGAGHARCGRWDGLRCVVDCCGIVWEEMWCTVLLWQVGRTELCSVWLRHNMGRNVKCGVLCCYDRWDGL